MTVLTLFCLPQALALQRPASPSPQVRRGASLACYSLVA